MTEVITNARKTIEKNQLKLRLEEMMTDSQKYDLLRAIYLLERMTSYKTKNLDEKEVRKHIRIKGVTTLNFESSDVYSIQFDKTKKNLITLATPFFSFTSNSGPLPQTFCELILDRERKKDCATSDFLDIFLHRLVTLFYLGKKKRDPSLTWKKGSQTSIEKIVDSLASLGRSSTEFKTFSDVQWLRHAGIFGGAPRSSSNLLTLIKNRMNLNNITCCEFNGSWSDIALQRSSLSTGYEIAVLGKNAVLGKKSWNISSGLLIEIKKLDTRTFLSLLPTGKKYAELIKLIYRFLPRNISVLLKLYLGQQDVKNCKLSRQSTMRLGWNSWLGDLTKTNPDNVMLEFRLDENRL